MPRPRQLVLRAGHRLEYFSYGSGTAALLVLPGGPGLTYHYLAGLRRLASRRLRVLFLHPRGVGRSWAPRLASAYTVPRLAADVEAVRRALDLREFHLLGFSAGGFVALEYAHRFGSRLTSLLLCATAGSAEEVRAANRAMLAAASPAQRHRLRVLTRAKAFDSPAYQKLAEAIAAPFQTRFLRGVPAEWKATRPSPAVYRTMMTRTGDEFAVDGTLARWDGRPYYSAIRTPTALVVGRQDFFYPAALEASRRLPSARLTVIPRASHLVVLEQPRAFREAVRAFLADVGRRGAGSTPG